MWGCSNSPTGAVILTLNVCSSVQISNLAGCVVSLKLMAIRTEVEAPVPRDAKTITSSQNLHVLNYFIITGTNT